MFASHSTAEACAERCCAPCLAVLLSCLVALAACPASAQPTAQPASAEPEVETPVETSTETGSAAETEAAAVGAGQLTKPPAVRTAVPPMLPEDTPPLATSSEVVLELTIDTQGHPENVVVLQGLDAMRDEAAREALLGFEFSPAEIDDAPAAVRIEYRFAFAATPSQAPAVPAAPSRPTGTLAGHIKQRGTRRPVVGASVRLPDLQRETLADVDGHFAFDGLPPGQLQVVVEDPGHDTLQEREAIVARSETAVTYYIEALHAADADLVAHARRPHKEVVVRTLEASAIASAPGTQGDAIKVIQNMPGVARVPFGGGDFVLRGGGYSEAYIDGQPVPNVFHFGGLRSIVGNGLLGQVDVHPGNYGARYGNANGGIVEIGLRAPDHEAMHGFGQVDIFDASLFLEGPISEHTSVAIGGRRSYIDGLLPLALDDEALSSFGVAPFYYDYQAMLDYDHGRNAVRAQIIGSYDRMVLLQDSPATDDPAVRGAIDSYESWIAGQVRYQHRFGADTDNDLRLGYLLGSANTQVGAALRVKFGYHTFTLRNDVRHRFSKHLTLRAGPDIRATLVNFDVAAPQPPRDGQPDVPLSALPILQARGSMRIAQPALWTELQFRLGGLELVPGLRVEHYAEPDKFTGTTLLQPRLTARYDLTPNTTLKAGIGHYSNGNELDEQHETFGNPHLGPEQSIHSSLGLEQRVGEAVLLDVTGFHKHLFDQAMRVDDSTIKYDNVGTGRAYGIELLAKYQGERLRGHVAYTLMRSERRDGPGEAYRLFELDQTHNLIIVAQLRLGRNWELGGRFRYVTGNPETPYHGAIYDSDADTFVPTPGSLYSTRKGAFHQLDLRIDRHFIFDTWRLSAYLEVQNAYNRKNPEATTYNYDYTERDTVAGLPLIPSLGVKGAF